MNRLIKIILLVLILVVASAQGSYAFWVWTPETNKWVNPKYAVKETPAEQLKYALEFFAAEEYKETIRELEKLLHHYPRSREAPDAQYYLGKTYETQEKLFEAFKAYQLVIDRYPFSERSSDIVKLQYDIATQMIEGNYNRSIMTSITEGDYDVVEVLRHVIKNAPYGDLAAVAQYKIGLYLMEKRLYVEARDEFEKVINDYPESEWAKAAQYQIAFTDAQRSTGAQYDQKITQAAVQEFEEFVATNPDAELSKQAKEQISALRQKEAENNFLVAQFYEKQRNYKAAKIYYEIIVDEFASSPLSVKALEKIREIGPKVK